MKITPTLLLLLVSMYMNGQTILNMSTYPAQPTPNDQVMVIVNSSFPSGGCDLRNENHSVNGNQITAMVYHCLGPLTFICYSSDTVNLGPLSVGSYTFQSNLLIGTTGGTGICNAYNQTDQHILNFTVTQGTGITEVSATIPQLNLEPASRSLILKASDLSQYSIELFDLTGKKVFSTVSSPGKINIPSSLVRGMYIYSLHTGDKKPFSGKVMLN